MLRVGLTADRVGQNKAARTRGLCTNHSADKPVVHLSFHQFLGSVGLRAFGGFSPKTPIAPHLSISFSDLPPSPPYVACSFPAQSVRWDLLLQHHHQHNRCVKRSNMRFLLMPLLLLVWMSPGTQRSSSKISPLCLQQHI
jgi:hypothetical protein